ncbi:unnamed protein product [Musa acuminata subsp. burmannicoides]
MRSGRSMRAFLTGLACLLCLGLFISVSVVGRGANATPPPPIPVTAAVVASSRGNRPTGDSSFDPFHASKRRVPNGPDPIHNSTAPRLTTVAVSVAFRRAGRFGRPPVRA